MLSGKSDEIDEMKEAAPKGERLMDDYILYAKHDALVYGITSR